MRYLSIWVLGSVAMACGANDDAGTSGGSLAVLSEGLGGMGGMGGGGPGPCVPTASVTLRNGENGYNYQSDHCISKASPTSSYCGSPVWVDVMGDPGTGNEESALFKWELPATSLPVGARVCSASLQFYVLNNSVNPYQVFALKRDWVSSEVTWNAASASQLWALPGAFGTDDRGSSLTSIPATTTTGPISVSLPSSVVQTWVNNPVNNHGIIVGNRTNPDLLLLARSAAPNVSRRPGLTVSFMLP